MRVIDSGPIFREYYTSTHQRVDYLPQDGHWNATGHQLMARAVAGVINAAPAPFRVPFVSLAE